MTAEEYIKAYTRGNSNELVGGGYHEWLTPENALAAVELAREEMMKDAIDAQVSYLANERTGMKNLRAELPMGTELDFGERVKVIIIKE